MKTLEERYHAIISTLEDSKRPMTVREICEAYTHLYRVRCCDITATNQILNVLTCAGIVEKHRTGKSDNSNSFVLVGKVVDCDTLVYPEITLSLKAMKDNLEHVQKSILKDEEEQITKDNPFLKQMEGKQAEALWGIPPDTKFEKDE